MSRSFSEREKDNIRNSLVEACRQSWTQFGYKKTSVDELCKQAGISKGAFYSFFETKEALFCDVLCGMQAQIFEKALHIMETYQNKRGAAEAIKFVYREYDKNNFLHSADSTDFTILTNKLSAQQLQKLLKSNEKNRTLFLEKPYLHFKIDSDIAIAVIYSLIISVKNKNMLADNRMEVFDFMVDHLIDDIYE